MFLFRDFISLLYVSLHIRILKSYTKNLLLKANRLVLESSISRETEHKLDKIKAEVVFID